MPPHRYEKEVAITGIGQSEVARPSSKSAMHLTLDACLEAIADAGLERHDIDGVACWPGDNNNGDPFSPVGPSALKSALGLNVNWFGAGYEGPGPLAGVINGAMAIAAGLSVSDSQKFIRKPKEFLEDVASRNGAFLGEQGNVIAVSAPGGGMDALRNRTKQLESQVRAVRERN